MTRPADGGPETRGPETPRAKDLPQHLKLAIDFGPLAAFFLAYSLSNLFVATAALMIGTALAVALSYALTRHVSKRLIITSAVLAVFGGLTLWLHDERFLKMKPTIAYTLFGVVLLGGLAFGRSLLGVVFEGAFKIEEEGWRKLSFRWGLFFLAMAVVNEYVWRSYSEQTWVYFKLFGFTALTFVFAMTQVPLIQRYTIEDEPGTPKA